MARREMDGIEAAEFLDDHMTGVLGLADGSDAYAIPVSYTYRSADDACYFRFGYGPDSQKRRFLEATDRATFVVYEREQDGWASVLVEGSLTLLTEGAVDADLLTSVKNLRIPYFDVFDRPHERLEFEIARLGTSSVTGIVQG